MILDFYSYGRSLRAGDRTLSEPDEGLQTFSCAGCGCSATARDESLVLTIGWRLLPGAARDGERPALCPRCARRSVSSLV
jgi:hypothetical protein